MGAMPLFPWSHEIVSMVSLLCVQHMAAPDRNPWYVSMYRAFQYPYKEAFAGFLCEKDLKILTNGQVVWDWWGLSCLTEIITQISTHLISTFNIGFWYNPAGRPGFLGRATQ